MPGQRSAGGAAIQQQRIAVVHVGGGRFGNRFFLVALGRDANVEELGVALGVSEATIRRDLTTLANRRRLVRTYGGATAL